MIKRILLFSFVYVAFLSYSPSLAAQPEVIDDKETLRVGIYDDLPLVFQDDSGKAQGIFIDILDFIERKEKWSLTYIHDTWINNLNNLKNGSLDLVVNIAQTSERDAIYDFSKSSVISNWGVLYTHTRKIDSVLELENLHIGGMEGDLYFEQFQKLLTGFNINATYSTFQNYEETCLAMRAHDIDAGVLSRFYGYLHAKEMHIKATPIVFSPVQTRFATKKGTHAHVISTIDTHLQALKADRSSTLYESFEHWLGEFQRSRFPWFLVWSLGGVCFLLLLFFLINRLLKKQVAERTKELLSANDKIIKSERLAAMGQTAGTLAHEFKNHLGVMQNATFLLKLKSAPLDEKAKRAITIITEEIGRVNKTIDNILSFSRTKQRVLENISINELLTNIVESLALRKPASIECILDMDEKLPMIEADKVQLTQVFENLIINAFEAMKDSGSLTLRTATDTQLIIVECKDTGEGIPESNLGTIFEPLFTTKASGTGFGLATVKQLTQENQGTIDVESTVGTGTTFTLRFFPTMRD